ncbi:MAG TPA: prepilin-type N-terminal cleavage/methylation domain-containing protein [Vicinamibacterales bacterium]
MSNNERGFTLVEAIVAVMICTIGLVAMAELLAVTLRLQQLGRNSTSAVRLAQDKVDELTTMNFATNPQASCGGSLDPAAPDANHSDTPMEDNGTPDDPLDDTVTKGYTRLWLIEAGPDGDANLRQVTVRVVPDVADRRTAAPYDLVTFIRGVGPVCP